MEFYILFNFLHFTSKKGKIYKLTIESFNMKIIIKSAKIEDLKRAQELNQMLFEKEYTEFDNTLDCTWTFSNAGKKYFSNRITKNDGCLLVALIDNEIVGYLAGGIIETKKGYRKLPISAELENMFVLEKYRSKGVGSKLYQSFVEWSKSKSVGKLRVVASSRNLAGINFYRKNGFNDYDLTLEKDI